VLAQAGAARDLPALKARLTRARAGAHKAFLRVLGLKGLGREG
jgi:hypothetical protein